MDPVLGAAFASSSGMKSNHRDINGIPMRWEEHGVGAPVVFVHGIPTTPALWRHVVPLVRSARSLAWEMTGYGDSIPAGRGRHLSVSRQADHLLAWLDALELRRVILVGHDLGGGVAQIAAVRRPELFAGLLLTNCIAYDSRPHHLGSGGFLPDDRVRRAAGTRSASAARADRGRSPLHARGPSREHREGRRGAARRAGGEQQLKRPCSAVDASHIGVASYNVHGCVGSDGVRDPRRTAAVISERNAAIVGLQEVCCADSTARSAARGACAAFPPGCRSSPSIASGGSPREPSARSAPIRARSPAGPPIPFR